MNYAGGVLPSVFDIYDASVVVGSFSKTLSLAGESIGYLAVNPQLEGGAELMSALILTTRILGYFNAPTVAQQILIHSIDARIDLEIYSHRRDLMAEVLTAAGIEFTLPKGAFYFFPKSPIADDGQFVQKLLAERILGVPGRGFGGPGYFRLAFCVSEQSIVNSAEGFKRAMKNC